MMIIEIKICNDIRFFYSVKGEIPECFNYDPDNKLAEYVYNNVERIHKHYTVDDVKKWRITICHIDGEIEF